MLTAIIAVIAMISVNGQVSIGVKAGLNLASISGTGIEDSEGRTSFHAGVVGEFSISEKFSFQPELIYSSQGATYGFLVEGIEDSPDMKYDVELKLDYLNIPLIGKYYVREGLSIETGPQIAFLLSSELETEIDGEAQETEEIENIAGSDFAWVLGMGYKMDIGLNFGARYNFGLININKAKETGNLNNGVFQLSVGYFF